MSKLVAQSFSEKLNITDDQPENFVKRYSSFKRRWSTLILIIDIIFFNFELVENEPLSKTDNKVYFLWYTPTTNHKT